jgi:uncharacterized protein (DUF39 family)
MAKSYDEINERIRQSEAVVVTAEEMIDIVEDRGAEQAAEEVDVVTTGTFGMMCSSGVLINTGHTTPRMKIQRAWLNDVPAYGGLAAVDIYLGATELPLSDPLNKVYPGEFRYGGAHVIEALVRGEDVVLRAEGYGTDCYPRREIETLINLRDLPSATLLNPRNAYQNYNVAVNGSRSRPIHTYLGILRPKLANAGYSSAGQLSPLLNDPLYRTIGIGTRIFLGGGVGYVSFAGTQHDPTGERTPGGVPKGGAGTLAVMGDLKGMSADYLRGVSMTGYGATLAVGIGVPIPILDAEMARFTAVRDRDIYAPVIDYGGAYSENTGEVLATVSYDQLRSGTITVQGKEVRTASLSSYSKARAIAGELKGWIQRGEFLLSRPAEPLPGVDSAPGCGLLQVRAPNGKGKLRGLHGPR